MHAAESSQPPRLATAQLDLLVAAILSAVFAAIFVATEDPYSLGAAFFSLFVYAVAVGFAFTLVRRPRVIPVVLVLTLAAVALSWAVHGDGYPVTSTTISYTSTCTSVTNSTSGYVYQACQAVQNSGQDATVAFGWNFLAWAPLVGCLVYAVPLREAGRLLTYGSVAKMLRGAVPAAALMFILLGARSSGLIGSPITGLGPLNPYVAFRECDSTTSLDGCSFNSSLYLLVDFLFWLAVALLIALMAGGIYLLSKRGGGGAVFVDRSKAVRATMVLAVILVAGFTVVPAALTQGGAIVTSGNTFSFRPGDYIDVPFNSAHATQLTGSFTSTIPVDAYLLNSTQFTSFGRSGNWYCPIEGAMPVVSNATQGSFAVQVNSGSNNLVFCVSFEFHSVAGITVQVTSPIRTST